jgi:hypothetical protein
MRLDLYLLRDMAELLSVPGGEAVQPDQVL